MFGLIWLPSLGILLFSEEETEGECICGRMEETAGSSEGREN